MRFGYLMETSPEPAAMTDAAEGGAGLAWRLLATLEGGSLILGGAALLAYTARGHPKRKRRPVNSVLLTNTTSSLGRQLKQQFELHGCAVSTLVSGAISGAGAGAGKVDALVIVGAERRVSGLDDIAGLVSEDVYDNLRLLDNLSSLVNKGGYLAWACAGATSGAFSEATVAFDSALKASLEHAAKIAHCSPVWVGRCPTAELAADRTVAELLTCPTQPVARFSIRNAAYKVSGYIGRWLKIVT